MNILGMNYELLLLPYRKMKKEGEMDYLAQTITICSDNSKSIQETSMLHEIIEAIDLMLELKLDHDKICQLEVGLYQTLSANGVDLSPLFRG